MPWLKGSGYAYSKFLAQQRVLFEAQNNNLPALVVASSLLPGLIIFFLREGSHRLRTVLNMAGAVMKLVLVGLLIWGVFHEQVYESRWTLAPGLDLVLHADTLSVLFVALSTVLWLVTTVYAIGYLEHSPHRSRFFGFFSLCVSATVGLALAGNLFTFLIFYELLTLATYPLVAHRGTPEALRGARIYLAYTLGGGALLLIGTVWLYLLAGPTEFVEGGVLGQLPVEYHGQLQVIFLLLITGLGVKAALVPLHGWLPQAMVAPAPVSALLHAVAVVKAGVFTILKVVVYIFGIDLLATTGASSWLTWVAAFTILAASTVAIFKDNLKARLAYSTVSQLSYIVLGASLGASLGVVGGGMHIAMHAFGKITLFFCAGAIMVGAHKTEVSEMDGLGRRMPFTFLAFLVGSLSVIGLPPLGGSWSKWYLALGAADAGRPLMVAVVVRLLATL